MIDRGQGPPIVLVPGIQGRWEWMAPAVEALARRSRVITSSLCGDRGSRYPLDRAAGFENYTRQLESWLDELGLRAASVCGVSYGGLIALHFAALRPERVLALVLASTPGPRWRPDARVARYARAPHLFAPAFIARSPFRMVPEIWASRPGLVQRMRVSAGHLRRVLAAPMSPAHMAERVRLAATVDFVKDCSRIAAPTLVLTGEPELDRVVPVQSTREYATLIQGAETAELPRTGHIGVVTRPEAFAGIVVEFVDRRGRAEPESTNSLLSHP
jgi:pimeloyl-ACP methyl ester carboxylesterase